MDRPQGNFWLCSSHARQAGVAPGAVPAQDLAHSKWLHPCPSQQQLQVLGQQPAQAKVSRAWLVLGHGAEPWTGPSGHSMAQIDASHKQGHHSQWPGTPVLPGHPRAGICFSSLSKQLICHLEIPHCVFVMYFPRLIRVRKLDFPGTLEDCLWRLKPPFSLILHFILQQPTLERQEYKRNIIRKSDISFWSLTVSSRQRMRRKNEWSDWKTWHYVLSNEIKQLSGRSGPMWCCCQTQSWCFLQFLPLCNETAWDHLWRGRRAVPCGEIPVADFWSTPGTGCCY